MNRCPVTGKLRFASEHSARVALLDCIMKRQRGRNERRERDVYQCPKCHDWHMTSMAQPRRKTA